MSWLLLAILILCSGAISGSETALFGLTRHELRAFENSPYRFQKLAASLMAEPRATLLTLLIANTAVNVAIFAVSFISAEAASGDNPIIATLMGISALAAVIIFGEVLPKTFALSNAAQIAPFAAIPTRAMLLVLQPVRWILTYLLVVPATRLLTPSHAVTAVVSTDDLRDLVDGSTTRDVISTTESDMLQAVVGLSDISVLQVMTPRVDIRALSIEDTPEEIAAKYKNLNTDRLPIYGRNIDDIQGLLYARDFYLNPDTPVEKLIRPIGFVPGLCNLMQVIRHFRTTGIATAVVVDEFGGMEGLVTLANVMEIIVGDLPGDPFDDGTKPAIQIDENTYRLSGALGISEWRRLFGFPLGDNSVVTLGGLVAARLGRLPKPGDRVTTGNLILEVETVVHHRVQRLLLHRLPDSAEEQEGTA